MRALLIVLAGCGGDVGIVDVGDSDTQDTSDADTDADSDADADADTDADSDADSDADTAEGGGTYDQDFEDTGLFVDMGTGTQTLTDGARFVDTTGAARIGFGSSHSGANGMNIYNIVHSSATMDDVRFEMPLAALGTETVHVTFWVYNPVISEVTAYLRRDDDLEIAVVVPPQTWTEITRDLAPSTGATTTVNLAVGDIMVDDSFAFRIDDVHITAD